MPIKFNKELSSHLFKYISTIDIKFNPFDSRSKAARELLRQVQSSRFQTSNPKLKIASDFHGRADSPTASFKFIDGSETLFEVHKSTAKEMLFEIHLKAMQLDAEYEMNEKSVDE